MPKLRAWDKGLESMMPLESIDFEYGMINVNAAWRWFEEIEHMQSPGLKDNNGVEIFEGDIIFYTYFEKNANNRLVMFVNGQFITELIRHGYYKPLVNVSDDAKKIGNIYENPELLEPADEI
ncbi:YopX family protein [Enterococcus sp. OL5]|uniref:YopX family protein n=1 Tax=Enterococcus sp. OL5 TaxID=2590214 RepID=UPI001CB9BAF0|nr:YopX family protein [Enterococcus sp. OL5]